MTNLEEELMDPEGVNKTKKEESGCIRCGECCGIVAVNTLDIRRIEKATGMKKDEFTEVYERGQSFGKASISRIIKRKRDPYKPLCSLSIGDYGTRLCCMFLEYMTPKVTKCTIYDDRPDDCRKFSPGKDCNNATS